MFGAACEAVHQLSSVGPVEIHIQEHKVYASRLSEHLAELRPKGRPNSIVSRAMKVCDKRAISLVRYIYDDKYSSSQKHLTMKHFVDGLADSVKQLLMSGQNNKLLYMMLSPF